MASQSTWDARYRDLNIENSRAAQVLSDNLHLLPAGGRALDLASGLGGNALLLAQLGFKVTAYDISSVAVDKLNAYAQARALPVRAQCRDVTQHPPDPESFDVVVVSYFLERALTRALIAALSPGGVLYYQTFVRDSVDAIGPANPVFRLGGNELLKLFEPLKLLVYREEGRVGDISRGFRNEAMLVGYKE